VRVPGHFRSRFPHVAPGRALQRIHRQGSRLVRKIGTAKRADGERVIPRSRALRFRRGPGDRLVGRRAVVRGRGARVVVACWPVEREECRERSLAKPWC